MTCTCGQGDGFGYNPGCPEHGETAVIGEWSNYIHISSINGRWYPKKWVPRWLWKLVAVFEVDEGDPWNQMNEK